MYPGGYFIFPKFSTPAPNGIALSTVVSTYWHAAVAKVILPERRLTYYMMNCKVDFCWLKYEDVSLAC